MKDTIILIVVVGLKINTIFIFSEKAMKKQNNEGEWDKKEARRKKLQEKSLFKDDSKNEKTISHSLKKELKKKKQEIDEEEWEDWDRHYNR